MNYYKLFVVALSATRCTWSVDWVSEERGPCKDPYTGITISCDFEGHMTLDECREVTGDTIDVFQKMGFEVKEDYDSSLAHPILEVIFPK